MPTETPPAPAKAKKPTARKSTPTVYVILELATLTDGWRVTGDRITTTGGEETAKRKYLELRGQETGKELPAGLVAIPARSWKPTKPTPKVVPAAYTLEPLT